MKIQVQKIKLRLEHSFRLSRGTTNERENVVVEIDGHYGEGAPLYYLGQTPDDIYNAAKGILASFDFGRDFEYLRANPWPKELIGFPRPALCAVSQAIYGYLAAQDGRPLFEYLGLSEPKGIPTSFSFGISKPGEIETFLRAKPDFPAYKLKLGSEYDLETVKRFRELSSAQLRLDVNGGWNYNEAIDKIEALADYNIEFIEQPLAAGHYEELDKLTSSASIPIFVDEDMNRFSNLIELYGKAHGINVKLSKCGLLFDTLRIIQYAKQLGMKVLLGCMVESSIGITAALHLATLADYIDLDGNLLINNDPFDGASTVMGIMNLQNRNGLGAIRK
ncbi:MAG: hypothetical protein CO189_02190 [candidate division Zixibacteria bacterium CG_4_9_14_3_um_filter_46_8]|nr:MAG: hypothetical protein CO189_02190 [candidate division Zixibacteria bacterium CG_4_9_14_3_um_filter_46_8]